MTDLKLSRLVLGTMTFGSQVDLAAATEMVDVSREAGVTMLDTANAYNAGAAEELLGRILQGRRDDFQVATKVGMPFPDAGDAAPLSPAAIRACLEGSLRRLGTDHVDVYYLHQPDRSTPLEETLGALDEHVRAGRIRYVGVSNYAAWQLAELRCAAARDGLVSPAVSQPIYNLLARRIEEEYAEFATRAGLLNIVYNPLGGGLLTGKYRFEEPATGTGRFAANPLGERYRERYWDRRLFDAVETLRGAAEQAGVTLVETAFRWLLSRDAVDAVLIGASKVEHLKANLQAAEGPPLPAELVAACDAVWDELRGPAPAYNR
jgi:aryl-alcohol dehydrogenase-like predicted oxidoreductase